MVCGKTEAPPADACLRWTRQPTRFAFPTASAHGRHACANSSFHNHFIVRFINEHLVLILFDTC